MNRLPAGLSALTSVALALTSQACSPKEAQPTPTTIPDQFRPLAAQVCFTWVNEVKAAGRLGEGSSKIALEDCTNELSDTANAEGWPVGKGRLSHIDENATREGEVAISIAGQQVLPEVDAAKLAGLIREADPGK